MNENKIRIYDSTGVVPVDDPDGVLERAEGIQFSTVYPAGIFETFECFIPCDPLRTFPIRWGHRIVVRNGQEIVWEGFVANLTLTMHDVESGYLVEGLGYVALANKAYLYHRYIDRRTQSDISGVWMVKPDLNAADKCTYDQNNRLYWVPKSASWSASENAGYQYLGNGGGNVSRVDFTYYLSGCGNNWGLRLTDANRSTTLWSTSTNGSASAACSITLPSGSSAASLYFLFRNASSVALTPATDGSVYGKITDVAVYGEDLQLTYQTTVSNIIKSLVLYLSFYSASLFSNNTTLIATNSYDLSSAGFVCDDLNEPILQIMTRAGTFSASNFAYSVGVRESEAVAGGTRPVIYYERQPPITDYEYVVRLGDQNVSDIELVLSADPNELYNRLWVVGQDTAGKTQWVNDADDSRLISSTSRTAFLSRMEIVSTNQVFASLTAMADYGARFINANKDLKIYMRSPLVVSGTIRKKSGEEIPVSQVRGGQRIKIENFPLDVRALTDSTDFVFLISRTEYNDTDQTVSISCGTPDDLAVYLARQQLMNDRYF